MTRAEVNQLIKLFEQYLADAALFERPLSLAALLLSGLYQTPNEAFKVLKVSAPMLKNFQGSHLRSKQSIEALADVIISCEEQKELSQLDAYFYSLLCQEGGKAQFRYLLTLDKFMKQDLALMKRSISAGLEKGNSAFNIMLWRGGISVNSLRENPWLLQLLTKENINCAGADGKSAMVYFSMTLNGMQLLDKCWRHFKSKITSESLNQILELDDTKRLSPICYLLRHAQGMNFLGKHWHDIKDKIIAEDFNRAFEAGENKGESPLYYLVSPPEGRQLLAKHWRELKDKITADGLNRACMTGDLKGISPLYLLIHYPESRQLLIENWHDIKDKITAEGLNRACETGDKGSSPLFSFVGCSDIRQLFVDHW